MKTYVVTGYSGKMDGILMIVKAASPMQALKKIAGYGKKIVTNVHGTFLYNPTYGADEASIAESAANGEIRWFHQMFVAELDEGRNLDEAVCW